MLDRIVPDRPFCGLWSLWDMLELNAQEFVSALRALASTVTLIEGWPDKSLDGIIDPEQVPDIIQTLDDFAGHCAILGARITRKAVGALTSEFKAGEVTIRKLKRELEYVSRTFTSEMESAKLFALNLDDAKFYDGALAMFGGKVLSAFPSSAAEIEEAGRCLAFGRVQATIYHLMRVIEIALRTLSVPLGIADPKPSWNTIIRKLDKEVKKEPKDRILVADYAFLEGVSAQMHAVNRVWRTNAMHVDATFSLENARDIFGATKSLMQHLATQLSEPSASGAQPS